MNFMKNLIFRENIIVNILNTSFKLVKNLFPTLNCFSDMDSGK